MIAHTCVVKLISGPKIKHKSVDMIHSVTAVDIFTGELDSNGLLPSTCIFVKHLFLTVRCGREQGCRGRVRGRGLGHLWFTGHISLFP